jgi:small subunit ribosomal protein S3
LPPTGLLATDWTSKWYAGSADFADFLAEDLKIREFLKKKLSQAAVSRIQISRPAKSVAVTIHTARPGIIIGKKGEDIERLRIEVASLVAVHLNNVKISIEEIRKPELDAQLVAEGVASQLERRVMFRRAMRRSVTNAMRIGAEGIKINVSGRLNGAEIARNEWYREGRVPLHTLRANVDYGFAEALTTYGILGVKVWIYKGEVYDLESKDSGNPQAAK